MEIAKVNLPVACSSGNDHPMLLRIDSAPGPGQESRKGIGVISSSTGCEAVLDGLPRWVFIRHLFAPLLPAIRSTATSPA